MGQAEAHALLARLRDDDAFRERVVSARDAEAQWWIIREEGFLCTARDLEDVQHKLGEDRLATLSSEYLH